MAAMADRTAARGLRRANDPPLLILTSLTGGPKHGHALIKDIEAFAGVRLGPGALYGAMTRLEKRGLIEPLEADDRRRPYQITTAGPAALAEAVAELRTPARAGEDRLRLLRGAPARPPGGTANDCCAGTRPPGGPATAKRRRRWSRTSSTGGDRDRRCGCRWPGGAWSSRPAPWPSPGGRPTATRCATAAW